MVLVPVVLTFCALQVVDLILIDKYSIGDEARSVSQVEIDLNQITRS